MKQLNIVVAKQFAEAEQIVSQCAEIVSKQREMVANLKPDDADSRFAKELLGKFEVAQAQHIAHRDHLKGQLGGK
jgi:hypothetical protein